MKIHSYEYSPLWKLPVVKINPQKFAPEKITFYENFLPWNPLPTYKSYKWKKKQNYKNFYLEESCATQHPYQNNQVPILYTYDLTEILGLDTFFTEWKKSENRAKAKTAKWHLLASCTKTR